MKRKGSSLVVSTIMAALFFSSVSFGAEELKTTGPYDSLRDYIAALEARGRVLRVKEG
jgi:hypothetical protein